MEEPLTMCCKVNKGEINPEAVGSMKVETINERIGIPFDESKTLYPVMEIFTSIQGEGAMMGIPVDFIRFSGCNLACPWCDTKESWVKPCRHEHIDYADINEMRAKDMYCKDCHVSGTRSELKELKVTNGKYTWMTAEDIAAKCTRAVVVLTGGEPCLYDLEPLILELHTAQKFVCIETNGTLETPESIDWVVASPKPPEYAINAKCFFNELKYVVDDNFDVDCVPPENKKVCGTVWLQPCDYGKQDPKTAASAQRCVDLALSTSYLRVGIQLHKILAIK